jgi:hypothetical protein
VPPCTSQTLSAVYVDYWFSDALLNALVIMGSHEKNIMKENLENNGSSSGIITRQEFPQ